MNDASPSTSPAASPRPRPHPARGLLTTGLVGGWLTGMAWAVMTLIMIVAASSAGAAFDLLDFAAGAALLAMLALLAWIGGMICGAIGWFGMAAIYKPFGRILAWFTIAFTALTVIVPSMATGSLGTFTAIATLGTLVAVTYYVLQAIFWFRHGTARGLARLAAVGCIVTALSFAVVTLSALAKHKGEGLHLVIAVIAGPFGAFLAHLGGGLAMGRERETLVTLATFD